MNRYDLIILGQLAEKPCHGYDIKSFVEQHELTQWANITVSSLYNRLNWLSRHGFITGEEEQVGNRPLRTRYTITAEGKKLLHQEVAEFVNGFNDDPRTLGFAYLHTLPAKFVRKTLVDHISYLESEIERQKAIIAIKLSEGADLHSLSPLLSRMSLEHIQVEYKYMQAVLEVIEDSARRKRLKTVFDINT